VPSARACFHSVRLDSISLHAPSARRRASPPDEGTRAEEQRWNRRTWISLRCQKAQHRGRARQSALRVGRALEDAVMHVTGALGEVGQIAGPNQQHVDNHWSVVAGHLERETGGRDAGQLRATDTPRAARHAPTSRVATRPAHPLPAPPPASHPYKP